MLPNYYVFVNAWLTNPFIAFYEAGNIMVIFA